MTVSRAAVHRVNNIVVQKLFANQQPLSNVPRAAVAGGPDIFPYRGMKIVINENRDKTSRIYCKRPGCHHCVKSWADGHNSVCRWGVHLCLSCDPCSGGTGRCHAISFHSSLCQDDLQVPGTKPQASPGVAGLSHRTTWSCLRRPVLGPKKVRPLCHAAYGSKTAQASQLLIFQSSCLPLCQNGDFFKLRPYCLPLCLQYCLSQSILELAIILTIFQFLYCINTLVKIKQFLVVINTVFKIKQFLVVIDTVVKIKQFLVVINMVVKIKQFLVVINMVVKIKQFLVVINTVIKIKQFLVVINTVVKMKQFLVVINTVVKIKQFLVVINTVVKIKQFSVVINTVVKIKQFSVVINTVIKIKQFLVVINTVVKIKQFLVVINTVVKIEQFLVVINTVVRT